jgi:hypothetical protein
MRIRDAISGTLEGMTLADLVPQRSIVPKPLSLPVTPTPTTAPEPVGV